MRTTCRLLMLGFAQFMLVAGYPAVAGSAGPTSWPDIKEFLADIMDPKSTPGPVEFYWVDANRINLAAPFSFSPSRHKADLTALPEKGNLIEARIWRSRVTAQSAEARAALVQPLIVGSPGFLPFHPDYCIVYRSDQKPATALWINSDPLAPQMWLSDVANQKFLDSVMIATPPGSRGIRDALGTFWACAEVDQFLYRLIPHKDVFVDRGIPMGRWESVNEHVPLDFYRLDSTKSFASASRPCPDQIRGPGPKFPRRLNNSCCADGDRQTLFNALGVTLLLSDAASAPNTPSALPPQPDGRQLDGTASPAPVFPPGTIPLVPVPQAVGKPVTPPVTALGRTMVEQPGVPGQPLQSTDGTLITDPLKEFAPDYCIVCGQTQGETRTLWIDSVSLQMQLWVTGKGRVGLGGINNKAAGAELENLVETLDKPSDEITTMIDEIRAKSLNFALSSLDPKQAEDVFQQKHLKVLGTVALKGSDDEGDDVLAVITRAKEKYAEPSYTAETFRPGLAVCASTSRGVCVLLMAFDDRLAKLYVAPSAHLSDSAFHCKACIGINNTGLDQVLNNVLVNHGKALKPKSTSSGS
jgi:hypothetical protein